MPGRNSTCFLARLVGLAVLIVCCGCVSRVIVYHETTPLTPNPSPGVNGNLEYVFYALPKTLIEATVKVQLTKTKPGELAKYTPCLFRGQEYIAEEAKSFSIKEAQLDVSHVPDPANIYRIRLGSGLWNDATYELKMQEDGVLSEAAGGVTNRSLELALAGLGVLSGLPAISLARGGEDDLNRTPCEQLGPEYKSRCEQFRSCEKDQLLGIALFSDFLRALEIRDRIWKLQNTDPAHHGIAERRTESERLLEKFFLGSSKTDAWEPQLSYEPEARKPGNEIGTKSEILFKYSTQHGVCKIDSPWNSDVVIPADFDNENQTDCKSEVSAAFGANSQRSQLFWIVDNKRFSEAEDRSFRYRMPAHVVVTASDKAVTKKTNESGNEIEETKTRKLAAAELAVAQLGAVASLPASTGGRKTHFDITLSASGALTSFKVESDGLVRSEDVEATETLRDARSDALAQRKTDLENRVAILEAEEELRCFEDPSAAGCTDDDDQ